MALSNSQYDAIIREYGRQQLQNKHEQDKRVAEIYRVIPAVRELDEAITTTAADAGRRLLAGDDQALPRMRAALADLREQKEVLLRSKGYPADYMEMHYRCPDCRDTGYVDGKKCHCFRKAQMRLLYAQSNIEEVVRRENFSTFSYDYYDDEKVLPGIGRTAREHMRQVTAVCRQFVEEFGEAKGNILLTGNTGVGKTFLANCIAKELMDRYYSVIYLSSGDLFDIFSKWKFDSQAEEGMKDMYEYILDCDLLVIDDLGTELNNSFTSSQLFYCLNERLNRKKGTVISTNLSLNALRDTYTERVTSRIMSYYRILPVYGDDIRLKKRREGRE